MHKQLKRAHARRGCQYAAWVPYRLELVGCALAQIGQNVMNDVDNEQLAIELIAREGKHMVTETAADARIVLRTIADPPVRRRGCIIQQLRVLGHF